MGTCLICGADVDGHVCTSHEEDVCFEFTGRSPEELRPGRFYRGSVDGFADFGVFIDIGDHVTGLLHTSELDRRLESLDWQPGETVFVQVKNVRDNGNVDLGWSIRQRESEFRGALVHTPTGDELPESAETNAGTDAQDTDGGEPVPTAPAGAAEPEPPVNPERAGSVAGGDAGSGSGGPAVATTDEPADDGERFHRTAVEALADSVGDPVRIEGRVRDIRQTSGPTLFEIRDETGVVECAAFKSAGVRAYPEVEEGDLVRLDGEVEERRGDIQVETTELTVLEDETAESVADRLEAAVADRARPPATEPLADHPALEALDDAIAAAATAIRRGVFESRPVVLRHSATVDGYLAAAAIERAVIPLIRDEHDESSAEYHYVDRRPLRGRIYGMRDAIRDVTSMLDAKERHGEALPLFVFVTAGSTGESREGLELLSLYGVDRLVIDAHYPDEEIAAVADPVVNPHLTDGGGGDRLTGTAIAAEVAVAVNPAVREDLRHLPATSDRDDPPEVYASLAADAGYDAEARRTLREAIAIEAHYRSFDDKRELIEDLLFGDRDLATHASEQYRERIAAEVRTARPHLEELGVAGSTIGLLDTDAYTHQYDFPSTDLLLEELADRADGLDALIGVGEDRLLVWSERSIDIRTLADGVEEAVPDGGVEARGGRDGWLTFLVGAREPVIEAAVRAVAEQL